MFAVSPYLSMLCNRVQLATMPVVAAEVSARVLSLLSSSSICITTLSMLSYSMMMLQLTSSCRRNNSISTCFC
jgi:hypothetical protein